MSEIQTRQMVKEIMNDEVENANITVDTDLSYINKWISRNMLFLASPPTWAFSFLKNKLHAHTHTHIYKICCTNTCTVTPLMYVCIYTGACVYMCTQQIQHCSLLTMNNRDTLCVSLLSIRKSLIFQILSIFTRTFKGVISYDAISSFAFSLECYKLIVHR